MTETSLRVACLQLNSQDDIAANAAAIETLAEKAVAAGAQLLALPENAYLMEAPAAPRRRYAQNEHPGAQHAAQLAKHLGCWLLVGSLAVQVEASEKTPNRSLLFGPDGREAAHYDKIHLFDVTLPGGETYAESARMQPGHEAVCVPTPWGLLGLTICYDVRFPHLYRALAQAGAGMLAVPAAFTATTGAAHWHVLLRARAIETGCFVIAPAQCGTHPGSRKTYGHSLIVNPWGEVLADGGEAPGFVIATLDLSQVGATRARIPSLQHGREFIVKKMG
ncbi:MAG: carbon-nitrogen hydrolase family protein [Alphaproteobacteria bacterium]|nr:carbon-nitrogen hydrolase family protein [Alphaproteobacteria bacterium]